MRLHLALLLIVLVTLPQTLSKPYMYNGGRYIFEYRVPTPHSGPIGITVDPGGVVWFAETNVSRIARFNPNDQTFREYIIPTNSSRIREQGAQIWCMKLDGRGGLWFTEATEAAIWRFDTSTETFERYPLPLKDSFPIQLTFGPHGHLWFTELYGDRVGRLDPSKVVNNTSIGITEYEIPTRNAGAAGLVFDDDGNLWFTESFSKKVAMFNPREVYFKEYDVPGEVYALVGIARDREGRFWITDHGSSKFYRFDPEDGEFKEYSTSQSTSFSVSLPYYILSDSEGRIWMNEHYGNIIAMMDPERDVLTEYDVPTRNPRFGNISDVLYLTADGDGEIWFTEWSANKIGRLNTHLPVPFTIDASKRNVHLKIGEKANVTISASFDEAFEGPLRLQLSGTMTPSGRLDGLDVSFNPGELTPETPSSTLTLKADRTLIPGVYTLMVGGKYRDVSRMMAVELVVSSPSMQSPLSESLSIILLALTPILAFAAFVLFRRFRAGSKGSLRAGEVRV